MATLYSVQGTKINNAASGTYAPIGIGELGGRVRAAYFAYTASGAEATSDVIRLTKLPAQARVFGIIYQNDDFGTTFTADIGDTGDTDRLFASLALGTASTASVFLLLRQDTTEADENPDFGMGYQYTSESWISITATSVSTPTAGSTLRGAILYTLD